MIFQGLNYKIDLKTRLKVVSANIFGISTFMPLNLFWFLCIFNCFDWNSKHPKNGTPWCTHLAPYTLHTRTLRILGCFHALNSMREFDCCEFRFYRVSIEFLKFWEIPGSRTVPKQFSTRSCLIFILNQDFRFLIRELDYDWHPSTMLSLHHQTHMSYKPFFLLLANNTSVRFVWLSRLDYWPIVHLAYISLSRYLSLSF